MNKKSFLASAAMITISGAALAVPVVQNPKLTEDDMAEIVNLQQRYFDTMEAEGIAKTMNSFLIEGGANDGLPQEMSDQARIADTACGTVKMVESTTERTQGSIFLQRRYVAIHEACVIYWKLNYVKFEGKWRINHFLFNTEEKAI
jgi:hypothetical protein